jgi:hypothetical protein
MEDNKEKVSWSKSIDKDGTHKSIRVEQVENGYVLTISKSTEDKYETKTYISKTNPFEKQEEEEDTSVEDLSLLLNNF